MINPDFSREQTLIDQGFSIIAGVDEVGRGCWAGPVIAAAVIFPTEIITEPNLPELTQIRDSKTLSLAQRERLRLFIEDIAAWAIGEATVAEIDQIGISNATHLAMERAISGLTPTPTHLLIDGRERINSQIPQTAIIDGDALSTTIAAASIIAKVHRDNLMAEYDVAYPGYQFGKHVGYGTKAHQLALQSLGACDLHRRSFKPIQRLTR